MNAALEFHDSEVERITFVDGLLSVLFSEAYIHQSEGEPGVDPGNGYLQAIDLVFTEAKILGSIESYGDLSDGSVVMDGINFQLIPVPFKATGSISAQLVFKDGSVISLSARSIACQPIGPAKWLESYPGA